MYFAQGQQCHVYSVVDDKVVVQPVTVLHSDHEEADIKRAVQQSPAVTYLCYVLT